jgi:DNA-binding NtrC family response regulator
MNSQEPSIAASTQNRTHGSQATVLCVDDDATQQLLTKIRLERAGFRVLTASRGHEALAVLAGNSVDVVVLDYWMPDAKGTNLAREIKKSYPGMPIVIFSGFAPMLDERIGPSDDWVVKGGAAEDLPDRIHKLLNRRKSTPLST